jgi:hypothetical protein
MRVGSKPTVSSRRQRWLTMRQGLIHSNTCTPTQSETDFRSLIVFTRYGNWHYIIMLELTNTDITVDANHRNRLTPNLIGVPWVHPDLHYW